MKKLVYILALLISLSISSCTDNTMAKEYGGTTTINLPKGQKLVEATWKESNIWYLTESMDSDYVPKTKTFSEDSRFGVLQGRVTFIESR